MWATVIALGFPSRPCSLGLTLPPNPLNPRSPQGPSQAFSCPPEGKVRRPVLVAGSSIAEQPGRPVTRSLSGILQNLKGLSLEDSHQLEVGVPQSN